jgi:hypothetical protein
MLLRPRVTIMERGSRASLVIASWINTRDVVTVHDYRSAGFCGDHVARGSVEA